MTEAIDIFTGALTIWLTVAREDKVGVGMASRMRNVVLLTGPGTPIAGAWGLVTEGAPAPEMGGFAGTFWVAVLKAADFEGSAEYEDAVRDVVAGCAAAIKALVPTGQAVVLSTYMDVMDKEARRSRSDGSISEGCPWWPVILQCLSDVAHSLSSLAARTSRALGGGGGRRSPNTVPAEPVTVGELVQDAGGAADVPVVSGSPVPGTLFQIQ